MNLLGFWILSILYDQEANTRLKGMTVNDIDATENLGCEKNTIYKQLHQFIVGGYVALGIKDGHANTYYITNNGVVYLRKESGK